MVDLCTGLAPLELPEVHLTNLDGFLALVPGGDSAALRAMAGHVVQQLDAFRAPLTQAERDRRRPDRLTPRQRDLLERWGYPYVMEEFRFHMTLSDRLSADDEALLRPLAEGQVLAHAPHPFPVDALALFVEGEDGLFHEVHRASLR